MRRLIFCFDGTWNRLSSDNPTNVVLTAEMIKPVAGDGTPQIVYYDEGIGTADRERLRGGAFGAGMMVNIREAYRFLLFNYLPGDEIYAFGFSRGAFTASSFCGFIRHAGIIDADNAQHIDTAVALYKMAVLSGGTDSKQAMQFRADYSCQVCVSEHDRAYRLQYGKRNARPDMPILNIRYVGLWDSVAALGLPKFIPFSTSINRKRHAHDVRLTSKVRSARHALALDERRILFEPVLWNNIAELNADNGHSVYDHDAPYQQKWFPGTHGSVGGGGPQRGLSDAALVWVLRGARNAGLEIRNQPGARAFEVAPRPLAPLINFDRPVWHDRGIVGRIKTMALTKDRAGPDDPINVTASTIRRWRAAAGDLPEKRLYRPKSLKQVALNPIEVKGETFGHRVAEHETLSALAKTYLGDASRYPEIFAINRDMIDDPEDLAIGVTLKIPAVPGGKIPAVPGGKIPSVPGVAPDQAGSITKTSPS